MRTFNKISAALAALTVFAFAASASAHVTANPGTAPAGGYARIDFRVPHGCEGAPTDTVEIQIPEGVTAIKPLAKAGWVVETEMVETEPYEMHGETMTTRIGVVRWSNGSLPDNLFDDFAISAKFPDAPGTTLYFPTVQYCGDATQAWIELPQGDGAELSKPAPKLEIVATPATTTDPTVVPTDVPTAAEVEAVVASLEELRTQMTTVTASTTAEGDASSSPLPVIALVASLVALAATVVARVKKG